MMELILSAVVVLLVIIPAAAVAGMKQRVDSVTELAKDCGLRLERIAGSVTMSHLVCKDANHARKADVDDLSKRVAALEAIRQAESQTVEPANPIKCRCSRCKGPTTRYVEGLMIRDGILWFNHTDRKVEPICFSCCDKAGIPRRGGVT